MAMKIALLGFAKIKYMPYMQFYLQQIDPAQDEVHVIYWERDDHPDAALPEGVQGHPFHYVMADSDRLKRKLPGFAGYSRHATRVIHEVNPDFLIVMYSTTAITVYPLLRGKYKGRYIFDFRDLTYEYKPWYRRLVAKIVEGSALSFTSSDGFRKFLPDTPKLLTSHNLTLAQRQCPKPLHTPIRVGFWGLLRHLSLNRLIVKRLGNDPRFELHYYGRAQGGMEQFIRQAAQQYENVFFHGEYAPEERVRLAAQTDLLHNMFSNQNVTMPHAMANKYYDGLMFAVPQLCMSGSLMGDLCTQKGVGLACDPSDPDFADHLYAYYTELDRERFAANCDTEFNRVLQEIDQGNRCMRDVLGAAKQAFD